MKAVSHVHPTPQPVYFDEFFDSGMEEAISPFLTPSSRRWGKDLPLRAAILSALFLTGAFATSFSYALAPLGWVLLALVYLVAGIPKLIDAFDDVLSLEINIDVLMTLAAFSSIFIDSAIEGGLLLVLFAISGSIEETVTSKARSAVRSLHKLSPTKACVIVDGKVYDKHIAEVGIGTRILIKAGEIAPLDGTVVEGTSSLNLSHLTGESMPVKVEAGDAIPAGGRNLDGRLVVSVTHISKDSTLSRIIRLITQAQEAKPKFQRWLDKASRTYAMSIIALSFLFALAFPFLLNIGFTGEEGSIYRALAFLIAASPCALIIALPIAYLSAVSACARSGILLKGGVTLDAIASCTQVAFDKTGTLTSGELTCTSFEPLEERSRPHLDEALSIAIALEQNAVHPIAQAILHEGKGIAPATLRAFCAIPGYGLEATYEGTPVYIGLPRKPNAQIEALREEGKLVALFEWGQRQFLFSFQDEIRPDIRETLETLRREHHLRLLMLTGDHKKSAAVVAEAAGLDEFYADLRPEDKLRHVEELSKEGLAMIGDGINDGPALARATTGISMGKVGSRTAIDASDVVLLQDNLALLTWLWSKAKATKKIVRQNVTLACIAIVGASLPALFGMIPLWLAVILHEGGTVLVGLNALRLLHSSRS